MSFADIALRDNGAGAFDISLTGVTSFSSFTTLAQSAAFVEPDFTTLNLEGDLLEQAFATLGQSGAFIEPAFATITQSGMLKEETFLTLLTSGNLLSETFSVLQTSGDFVGAGVEGAIRKLFGRWAARFPGYIPFHRRSERER